MAPAIHITVVKRIINRMILSQQKPKNILSPFLHFFSGPQQLTLAVRVPEMTSNKNIVVYFDCWLGDRKGIWPVKSRVLVCWW